MTAFTPSYASSAEVQEDRAKRGPGRPPKSTSQDVSSGISQDVPPSLFSTPEPPKRGRKGLNYLSTTELEIVFRSIAVLSQYTGVPETQFTDAEITHLSEVWVRVINQYPSILKYFTQVRKVSVWGDAVITTVTIIYAKSVVAQMALDQAAQNKPQDVAQDMKYDATPGTNGATLEGDIISFYPAPDADVAGYDIDNGEPITPIATARN